jgi:hypothetical protein
MRQAAYRDLVMETIDPEDTESIRLHLQRGYALGSNRLRLTIETQLNRRAAAQDRPLPQEGRQRTKASLATVSPRCEPTGRLMKEHRSKGANPCFEGTKDEKRSSQSVVHVDPFRVKKNAELLFFQTGRYKPAPA